MPPPSSWRWWRVALCALPAIALLHAAGAATAMVFIRNAFSGDFGFDLFGETDHARRLPAAAIGPPAWCAPAWRSARSLLRPDCGTPARLVAEQRHARRGLGRMGRRRPAGHPVLASGSPSAISTAISVMPRSPLSLAVGFALAGEADRARRRAAADRRSAVSFALAGAGIGSAARPAYGLFGPAGRRSCSAPPWRCRHLRRAIAPIRCSAG